LQLIWTNLLYAAIMQRLTQQFGVQEGDLVAWMTLYLLPILATMAVVAVIYWGWSQNHTDELSKQRRLLVRRAFAILGDEEINWPRANYTSGRPPSSLVDALLATGVIYRDFVGFGGLVGSIRRLSSRMNAPQLECRTRPFGSLAVRESQRKVTARTMPAKMASFISASACVAGHIQLPLPNSRAGPSR